MKTTYLVLAIAVFLSCSENKKHEFDTRLTFIENLQNNDTLFIISSTHEFLPPPTELITIIKKDNRYILNYYEDFVPIFYARYFMTTEEIDQLKDSLRLLNDTSLTDLMNNFIIPLRPFPKPDSTFELNKINIQDIIVFEKDLKSSVNGQRTYNWLKLNETIIRINEEEKTPSTFKKLKTNLKIE